MNSKQAVRNSSSASVNERFYEGYSYEEEIVADVSHRMKAVEMECKQDGERELAGKNVINQPDVDAGKEMNASSSDPKTWDLTHGAHMQSLGDSGAGSTSHNSWANVVNSKESVGGGKSNPRQADSSWGSWDTISMVPSPALPGRTGKPGPHTNTQVTNCNVHPQNGSLDVDSGADNNYDDELLDDSEDDFSEGFDSDDSQKSHDTRKKNKWFRPFFEILDNMSLEQINEKARQWHCPACQDGPGAIDWYTGLQPLMAHAKTKGRLRMRLHRELAELLEEELQRRGTSIVPSGEAFGKWKGLCETTADHEIVWPPMVVVMNTLLEKDDDDKWKGMGNQELIEYFNTYDALKARHSYGPNGHRGMSVLIFEASVMGYFEAERLHKQFRREGRDRDAWESGPALFYPGGKRQLYGFLASEKDLIFFNQHSHGKACLKFHMRSYQEMVVGSMKQMSEDNQKLIWLRNKVVKHEQRSKALEETFGMVSQKLRDMVEENRIVRLRTKIQHEENKEEMDHQEKFVKGQLDKIHKITEDKERAMVNQSDVNYGTFVGCKQRKEETERLIASLLEGAEEFEAATAKLIQAHEELKIELKQKHLTEEIELEKKFEVELTKLMEKYAPPISEFSNT